MNSFFLGNHIQIALILTLIREKDNVNKHKKNPGNIQSNLYASQLYVIIYLTLIVMGSWIPVISFETKSIFVFILFAYVQYFSLSNVYCLEFLVPHGIN